jgi:fructokinase
MIVVGGEALFDLVLGQTDRLEAHPGGGPFNTARTLGRLEQPVGYLGRLSSDRFGTRLRSLLLEDGVSDATVIATDEPTTLALAELDAQGGAQYRFYADGTSAAGLLPETAVAALPADVEMLHVGTLGLVLEPTALAMEAVVERLHGRALIALDPNIRPTIVADAAGYRARLQRMLARTDLVKLSAEDAAWLEPDLPPVEAARALLDAGPAAVVLTQGPAGAVAITRAGASDVPAPPVRVADTIGAGDAFGGGLLAWWRRAGLGRDDLGDLDALTEATRFAVLVAARTVERPGASPPWLRELEPRSARRAPPT